jgi:tripartite-type tricarboxylate transporter receptor subunit TctC
MPRDLVDQLNKAFAAVLQDEEVAKRFKDLGMNIAGGSPEDLAEVLKQDVTAFEKAAKLANISPQ